MADGQSTVGEVRVAPDRLHAFTMAICRADGSSEQEARLVADHLVLANLFGHDSHGVGMMRAYIQNTTTGRCVRNHHAKISRDNGAWLEHILWHLAPNGTAGVVLANGSMSSAQSGEDTIRKAMVEADLVDCMISLPGQLFYSTQIPACLWFLARNKNRGSKLRHRRGELLFIDARKLGNL